MKSFTQDGGGGVCFQITDRATMHFIRCVTEEKTYQISPGVG